VLVVPEEIRGVNPAFHGHPPPEARRAKIQEIPVHPSILNHRASHGLDTVVKEKFYVPHTQWHRSVGRRASRVDPVIALKSA